MSENRQFSEFTPEKRTVTIRGQKYTLRELSLAQKIRVVGPVAEFINEIVRNVFIRKDSSGGIKIDIPDTLSIADLKVDRVLMSSVEALPEILALSVPDFKEWDNLSETETRQPLAAVMEINDFAGFVVNFISLAGKAIRLPRRS
jgi:hypothetical protein